MALEKEIEDLRAIYREDGLYGPIVQAALQKLIARNQQAWPGRF